MTGKIIAIEGTDGSGKATQTSLLHRRLTQEGHLASRYAFPQYKKPSAYFVEQYLGGQYDPKYTDAYASSLFYALDRYDLSIQVRQDVSEDIVVVLDRWVPSSLAHLGGKIADDSERRRFWDWLCDLEYNKLHVPKPDITIVLHVPTQIAQALLAGRGSQKDIHEQDFNHHQNAEAAYLQLCKDYPQDYALVECSQGGELLSVEVIHQRIYQRLSTLLPELHR